MNNSSHPFLPVFLSLIFGIYLANWIVFSILGLILWVGLSLWLLVLEYKGKKIGVVLFYGLLIFGGFLLGSTANPPSISSEHPVEFTARVISQRELTYDQRVIVKSPELRCKVALHLSKDLIIEPGRELIVMGEITVPERARNPGEFCYFSYLSSQGVAGVVRNPLNVFVSSTQSWYAKIITSVQTRIRNNLEKSLEHHSIVTALVLGDRSALSDDQHQSLQKLGVSHLFAISGMHINLLGAMLWCGVQYLPLSPNFRKVIITSLLLSYVLISGASPSAWRAWLGATITLLAITKSRLDGLQTWSLVGTIMLTFSPNLLWQISFQLSFLASGGIILWSPIINNLGTKFPHNLLGRFLKAVTTSLLISIIAQASLFPLLVYHFSEIALLAPLATLILSPLIMFVLVGGIILGCIGSILAPLAWVLDRVLVIVEYLSMLLSYFSYLAVIPKLTFDQYLIWAIIVLGFGWQLRIRRLFTGMPTYINYLLVGLALIVIISLPRFITNPLTITFLDVGQGDAIYINTPYNHHILIDGGGDSAYWQMRGRNIGLQTVVPFLNNQGVKALDLVILSHPHEDHLHGLLAVLEELPVGLIVDSGQAHTTDSYLDFLELIEIHKIPYLRAYPGDRIEFAGGVTIDILHPGEHLWGTASDMNNNSLVVNLSYQGRSVLFTGDLDIAGQQYLVDRAMLDTVDLVKVPHHGSKSALLPEFYQILQPQHAVVSVGNNSFGHPSPEVLEFLERLGVNQIYRTDRDGAVTYLIWNSFLGRVLE